ncbi:DUF502 domain-containing protein [Flavobacteriales bacterium]|jgi:uncharacterized membrane protein|nr:DUF502 domain-containing protein [Flavobacteriales bacterium]
MFKYYFKRIGSYFLQGVLLAVPVAATIYVVIKMFLAIDSIIPFEIPGLGLLALFITLTLLGFLGTTIIAQPIMYYFEQLMKKAPLLQSIYSAVKDLTTAFVGKKKSFTEPVLVKMMIDSDVEKFGFITNKDLNELGIGEDKVAVYLPHSYAFSGNLYIVPKKNVTPIDAKAADIMKFIVSGGVTTVDNE